MELTLEQIKQVLTDPRSPIAQELTRRAEEADKPGAVSYTSDEVLAMLNQSQRLSVNINDATAAILRKVMEERGISATEATRRAIGLLGWFEDTRHAGYRIVCIPPGETTQVEIPDFND